jgi:glycosyltransferase involved in cell wall biosynthesis
VNGRDDITIAAVIPTRGTENCVLDAVDSVRRQTMPVNEIIVVADGQCDSQIAEALRARGTTVDVLLTRRGANAARQRGVQIARSRMIAFLDDDDQWADDKIEKQAALLSGCGPSDIPVLYTAVSGRRGGRSITRPERLPHPGQRVQDYLFVRRDFSPGSAFLSTSTLLTRKDVLEEVTFDLTLPRHQDWDWLIRAQATYGDRLFLRVQREPLTSIRLDHVHGITASVDWKSSFNWARNIRQHLTTREYGDLLMVVSGSIAGRGGSVRGLLSIAAEACRRGRPSWRALVTFCGFAVTPGSLRRWLAVARPR